MSLLDNLAKNRFLIVGRGGMDFYPDPPGVRTEEATHFFAALGGSAANIGVAITRFGGEASLVTPVSDDAIGRYVVNQLDHYGIDRQYVTFVGGQARTSLAVVESRTEDHQSVIYRNGAADFELSIADVERPDYRGYGAFITTGTVFASEPSRSAGFHALERAKSAGLSLIFDIDHRPYSWPSAEVACEVYSRVGRACDVVVGNDEEFGFMAGDHARGLDMARELARNHAEVVVYKMGEHGAITLAEGREFRTGIYPVDVLKPTGAGDAFMGGFISSLAQGHDIEDAVLRGSACAAIVVSKVACAPAMPDAATLDEFLRAHDGPVLMNDGPAQP